MVRITSLEIPTEGIVHKEEGTSAVIQSDNKGAGVLYITESSLVWCGSDGLGFSLEYRSISIHAVSRDTTHFPDECLYMMVEEPAQDRIGDQDYGDTVELRFVPTCKENLDLMYQSMCTCQELHPDPEQNDSENEWYDEDNNESGDRVQLTDEGVLTMNRLNQLLANGNSAPTNGGDNQQQAADMETGQFEDADDRGENME